MYNVYVRRGFVQYYVHDMKQIMYNGLCTIYVINIQDRQISYDNFHVERFDFHVQRFMYAQGFVQYYVHNINQITYNS